MMKLLAQRYDTGQTVELTFQQGTLVSVDAVDDQQNSSTALPFLAPAFVDIQINGYKGQEFSSGDLTPDKVASIVTEHNRFGVARLCPTLTTESFEVIDHGLKAIVAACEQSSELDYRVLGIHVEGPYISKEDGPRGAHPLQHCREPNWEEFQLWQESAKGRICLITLSPEYDNAPGFIKKAVNSGTKVAIGHTSATSDQIRAAVDAGATLSTHLGNGAHGQLRRHPNYIWDQLADDRLTTSLIVDGHHLPAEVVKSFVRAKTPARCILVSDEGGLAGLPPGTYTSNSTEVEILDDGRIVLAGQRQLLAGASLPIYVGIGNIMKFANLDLKTAIDMASRGPMQLLGFEHPDLTSLVNNVPKSDLVLFECDRSESSITIIDLVIRGQQMIG